MELQDCAFPLLRKVVATVDLDEGFRGVNWALLVGSVPRKAGMERKDLVGINGKIFTSQGEAIARNAASDVRVVVVGNHSSTLFPDFFHGRIGGKPVSDTITDNTWLETDFIKSVQQRGAAIIQARGLSSAESAAQGVVDTVRSIIEPTPAEEWHSIALSADGSYGSRKDLSPLFPHAQTKRSWKSCRILCSTNSAKLKSNPPSTN
jgi:malate dehydrogenase